MALLPAYAVDGGRVPARMLRMVAWAATNGANGIVLPGDLKVVPLATPGGGVQIMPGGALLTMRYTNATAQQTYAVVNESAETLTIPATGSGSGRIDYIIVRIDDPEYGGQEPEEPLEATYASFERVSSISNLNYPFVALAKITLPPSTGTVTEGMITDLREVANPRTHEEVFVKRMNTNDPEDRLDNNDGTGEPWPDVFWQYKVPEWATHAQVIATYGQVFFPGGEAHGHLWTKPFGSSGPQTVVTRFEYDLPGPSRQTMVSAANLAVPPEFRGKTVSAYLAGTLLGAEDASTRPRIKAGSCIVLQIRFYERAE